MQLSVKDHGLGSELPAHQQQRDDCKRHSNSLCLAKGLRREPEHDPRSGMHQNAPGQARGHPNACTAVSHLKVVVQGGEKIAEAQPAMLNNHACTDSLVEAITRNSIAPMRNGMTESASVGTQADMRMLMA